MEEPVEPLTDGVFIHIKQGPDNPHEVLMALRMAEMMVETQDVLLYFDIDGVKVVLNDSEDITFGNFPSSHTQIGKLVDMGVTIMACPGCLEVVGKSGDDLMQGVKLAERETFFNFTTGRILTLDY
ncbi:MAG TPA: peroxiredoxin [candidate division Zixibacteria bacterium]|nr:peroxiredoxin [candidate division Zixibacteria bacterium]